LIWKYEINYILSLHTGYAELPIFCGWQLAEQGVATPCSGSKTNLFSPSRNDILTKMRLNYVLRRTFVKGVYHGL